MLTASSFRHRGSVGRDVQLSSGSFDSATPRAAASVERMGVSTELIFSQDTMFSSAK